MASPVEFDRVVVDDAHLTPFARRVTAACRRIPWGEVRTYGQLAAVCGSPDAARAVGRVMAANRYPLIVPCHRVLAAGGRLGGYSRAARPQHETPPAGDGTQRCSRLSALSAACGLAAVLA